MTKAVLVLLAALAMLPSSAAAATRLDTLAAELRTRSVVVDGELSWFVPDAERRRLERTLEASPVPVRVAFLPLLEADESGGDGGRVAEALRRRVGRPGLYLVVDERGSLDARASELPRRVTVAYGLPSPPSGRDDPDIGEIVDRIAGVVRVVAAAPPGMTTSTIPLPPLRGYREPYAPPRDSATGDAALGSAVLLGVLGLGAGGVARLVARRERRRDTAQGAEAARREERHRTAPAVIAERERRHAAKPFWRRGSR